MDKAHRREVLDALGTNDDRRGLQNIAARSFAQEIREGEDFTDNELRQEAAFRCWLNCLDFEEVPPLHFPDDASLNHYAHMNDLEYGEYIWWSWPAWQNCASCCEVGTPQCASCCSLCSFCFLSEEWEYAVRLSLVETKPYEDARLTAAYRTWVLQQPRRSFLLGPALDTLERLASDKDCEYGDGLWWDLPLAQTCDYCHKRANRCCERCSMLSLGMALILEPDHA